MGYSQRTHKEAKDKPINNAPKTLHKIMINHHHGWKTTINIVEVWNNCIVFILLSASYLSLFYIFISSELSCSWCKRRFYNKNTINTLTGITSIVEIFSAHLHPSSYFTFSYTSWCQGYLPQIKSIHHVQKERWHTKFCSSNHESDWARTPRTNRLLHSLYVT